MNLSLLVLIHLIMLTCGAPEPEDEQPPIELVKLLPGAGQASFDINAIDGGHDSSDTSSFSERRSFLSSGGGRERGFLIADDAQSGLGSGQTSFQKTETTHTRSFGGTGHDGGGVVAGLGSVFQSSESGIRGRGDAGADSGGADFASFFQGSSSAGSDGGDGSGSDFASFFQGSSSAGSDGGDGSGSDFASFFQGSSSGASDGGGGGEVGLGGFFQDESKDGERKSSSVSFTARRSSSTSSDTDGGLTGSSVGGLQDFITSGGSRKGRGQTSITFTERRSGVAVGEGGGGVDSAASLQVQSGTGLRQYPSFTFSERRSGSSSSDIDGGLDGRVGGAGQKTFSFRGGRTATSGTGRGAVTGARGGTLGFETRKVQTVSTGTDSFGFQPRRSGGATVQVAQNIHLTGSGRRVGSSPVVTGVPQYFTTTRYGPISSGGLRGEGERSSSLTYTRQGSASGSLFTRDQAEASETASKTRGYEYRYREGHNYEQPRTLYHYDIEEPIWGFADVDTVYRGE